MFLTKISALALTATALTSLFVSRPAHADDISFNGFGSAYYGQALNKDFLPYGFNDTHANFTSFSLMGINVGARLNSTLNFTAQLLALGFPIGSVDSYTVIAQWAYLKYQPFEHTRFKAGRQLMPSTIASEYVRVGYLLPFRELPPVVQTVPFSRFDGVSAEQDFDLGFGKLTIGAFTGSPLIDFDLRVLPPGNSFAMSDTLGVVATLDGDGWRLRAMGALNYNSETLPTAPYGNGGEVDAHRKTFDFGGRYDKHNVVAWAEYIATASYDNGTTSSGEGYLDHGESYYALLGYRIGKFMPRVAYGRGTDYFGISGNHGQSWDGELYYENLGVNYYVAPQVVIKLDYEKDWITKADAAGIFGQNRSMTTASAATSGDAVYLGCDFIF